MTSNQMENKRIQLGIEGAVNVARVGLGEVWFCSEAVGGMCGYYLTQLVTFML